VEHGIATFGCRVESEHGVLAYSADSGECQALVDLAGAADLLLCESFRSLSGSGERPTVMTPEQAGRTAAAAGAARLVLTHLHPDAEPLVAAARARTTFTGPVDVARQGAVHQVSPNRA
jgi:ribonuclease BN (tRNA processing enzyme)